MRASGAKGDREIWKMQHLKGFQKTEIKRKRHVEEESL